MAELERLRDRIDEPPSEEYWSERSGEGWRLVAVVWERGGEGPPTEEVPYGLRVATDCLQLEPEEREMEALGVMLEEIAADRSLSQVADTLNRRGFTTRAGRPWDQTELFELLPRLVEAAPQVRDRQRVTVG